MVATIDLRLSTGIAGLDEVLHGGLLPARSYLLTGPPGSGKTTLGWHFLCEGLRHGENVLFVTFGECERELRFNAGRSGFDVENVEFVDLSPSSSIFTEGATYDVFEPSEVEREPTVRSIVEAVQRVQPSRVFVDSMSHLRYLASDNSQYRRQTLAFIRFLVTSGAAVLMTSESSDLFPDDDLRFMSDGILELSAAERSRTITVPKFRGSHTAPGVHALVLTPSGAAVYPRLVPEHHHVEYPRTQLESGIPRIDEMLHGGIERGTITLFTGPSGVGKTCLGVQFMKEAATRGVRSAIYTFDERAETLLRRAELTNTGVRAMMQQESLHVVEIEALRYGPDEFANLVRADILANGTQIVMIDSVSGYRLSVGGDDLSARIHALCKYLQNVGVTVILINEMREINEFHISDADISYLADNVIYLRYLESTIGGHAALNRGIGVLKKRLSDFDKRLFAFDITSNGVVVGGPLPSLGGMLPSVSDVNAQHP